MLCIFFCKYKKSHFPHKATTTQNPHEARRKKDGGKSIVESYAQINKVLVRRNNKIK